MSIFTALLSGTLMNRIVHVKAIALLAILMTGTGVTGGYAVMKQVSIPLEVQGPLEILPYNASLHLFPGETLHFNVEIENHAQVRYNAYLNFSLSDTEYQDRFVTFSSFIYVAEPGRNSFPAWLAVSNLAPAAKMELTISINRGAEPSTELYPRLSLAPSATLLGAGARWAARNGTSVLYINWLDNYKAHSSKDNGWGPYSEENYLAAMKNTIITALTQEGFLVTCMADVPDDLLGYSLVVFEAYYAVEPKHASIVRNYLANGGGVVLTAGAPCYFSTYCKDMWPYKTGGQNLASLQDWFGGAYYVNSGGRANLLVDAPFGTTLSAQTELYYANAYGAAGVISPSNTTRVMASWENGALFAFTNEYGNGRIYYQATIEW